MRQQRIALAVLGAVALLAACGGSDGPPPALEVPSPGAPVPVPEVPAETASTEQICAQILSSAGSVAFPDTSTEVSTSTFVAASEESSSAPALPAHCQLMGTINKRISPVDGQTYAIGFHMRLPEASKWNGRFYFMGGGGTNGNLGDALGSLGGKQKANALSLGYAVVSTDSGHSNATNNRPDAGGTASFGVDPQARSDFYYNSYDKVTQLGKALVRHFYGSPPERSYFVGCSEGGREGFMMSQRFPSYYDGIVSGAPVFRIKQSISSPIAMRAFAAIAPSTAPDGLPSINKTYTDGDVQLIADAVAQACDGLDGLGDGIVSNYTQCTPAVVHPVLDARTCTGAKTASCLTAGQISAMKTALAAAVNGRGEPLYADWAWDPGFAGSNNGAFNSAWRSWWLGSFNATSNGATKLGLGTANLAMLWTTPPAVMPTSQFPTYMLNYDLTNFHPDATVSFPASGIYTESPGQVARYDSTDLRAFRDRGGKILIYHGVADPAVSFNDTALWYRAMDGDMGGASDFARFYPVPGMNHCSGGPATDQFDMLTPLVDWVEKGVAPQKILATASNPGFFGVESRTRPLCPAPSYPRYNGSGDVNQAGSFFCAAP